jgi:hypothetical protein
MAVDIFQPSSAHNASVVVNTDLPQGQTCVIEVYLGPAPGTKTVTSGKVNFTTPAPNTNSSAIICTVPAFPATGGTYHVYIALYDASGNTLVTWTNVNDALIFTGNITFTWA